jgi:hypothetical protein
VEVEAVLILVLQVQRVDAVAAVDIVPLEVLQLRQADLQEVEARMATAARVQPQVQEGLQQVEVEVVWGRQVQI